MEALAKLLGRFLSRDLIYLVAGCLVIASCLISFPALRSEPPLAVGKTLELIYYAVIPGIAYLVSYFLHEAFSMIGLTPNHEWWYPKDNPFGCAISWTHRKIHGVPLLKLKKVVYPQKKGDTLSKKIVEPSHRAHNLVKILNNLSSNGDNLRLVLYPYYIDHFDGKEEKGYWISRLTWLRFFESVGGSSLAVSGIILVGPLWLKALFFSEFFWIGLISLFLGLFLSLHAYYRSAQITLIRLLVLTRHPSKRSIANEDIKLILSAKPVE
jgi:hypothetical protein